MSEVPYKAKKDDVTPRTCREDLTFFLCYVFSIESSSHDPVSPFNIMAYTHGINGINKAGDLVLKALHVVPDHVLDNAVCGNRIYPY